MSFSSMFFQWVPLSMPPWPGSSTISGRGSLLCFGHGARAAAGAVGAVLQRDVAQEARPVDGGKIEHQPRRLAGGGGKHKGFFTSTGLGGVEHDARAAAHDQAVAVGGDQAAAVLAGALRQLEGDLRQVDHHPVGIGEREGGDVDLAGKVEHEAGLL